MHGSLWGRTERWEDRQTDRQPPRTVHPQAPATAGPGDATAVAPHCRYPAALAGGWHRRRPAGVTGATGPQSHRPRRHQRRHPHCHQHPHPAGPDPLPSRRRRRQRRAADGQTDGWTEPTRGLCPFGGVSPQGCPSAGVLHPGQGVPVLVQLSGCPRVGVPVAPCCPCSGPRGPSPGVPGCPRVVLVQAWVSLGCPCSRVPGVSLRGPVCPQPGLGVLGVSLCRCVPVSNCSRAVSPRVSLCGVSPGGEQTGRGRALSPPCRGLRGAQPGSA